MTCTGELGYLCTRIKTLVKLKKEVGVYLSLALLFVLSGVFVYYINQVVAEREAEQLRFRKEDAHQRAIAQFQSSIDKFAVLVSSIRAHIKNSEEMPDAEELQKFTNDCLEKLSYQDSLVVSYLDPSHTFIYSFNRKEINKNNLVGTNVASIRDEDFLKFLDGIMQDEELHMATPFNLVEGWLGIPLDFNVSRDGQSIGYIAPIINFNSIISSVYDAKTTEDFLFKFTTGDGIEFDRRAIYDGSEIYNDEIDPEYFRNHTLKDTFLTTTVNYYGLDLSIGTALKNPTVDTLYRHMLNYMWFSIIGITLFYLANQYMRDRKVNDVLVKSKAQVSQQNTELEKQKNEFTELLANVGDGVFELDSLGKCIYINSRMLQMLNRTSEEAMNTSIWELIYREDVAKMQSFYNEQFKNKVAYCYYEYRLTCKGKEPFWVGQSTTMQYDGDRMVKLRSIARDLTKTKFLEEELERKESLYQLVSENSRDLIALHELDGTYKYVSAASTELLGYQQKDLIGKNPYDLFHPEDVDRVKNGPHAHTVTGEMVENVEYRMKRKDGTYSWLETYAKPILNGKNEVVALQTSSRDISERKIEQIRGEKYKEGLTILNQLASSSLTGSELLDEALQKITRYLNLDNGIIGEVDGNDYYVRNAYLEASFENFKLSNPCSLANTYCDFTLKCETTLLIDDDSDFEYAIHPCFPEEKIETYIGTTILKKGTKYGTVNFFSKKARDEKFAHFEGEFIQLVANWLGSVLEADEEKVALEEATAKAEEASQAQASFLSVMSHEIRTPLNGIIGATHLLLDKSPREEQLAHLNILKQSADNLHAIVNDILDFNKIEEGKVELDSSRFDLKNLVETIYENYSQQGKEKGIEVVLASEGLAGSYLGDPVRIGQILHNLMNNAIKFTTEGQVVFKVAVARKHGAYDEIRFEISDTGIGIPKKKQQEIFEVFSQEDKSTTRKFGGSGLGLAITKRLLLLMEGEIKLTSDVGVGSTFSFDLILARNEQKLGASESKNTKTDFPSLSAKILLVEDNSFNMAIAKDFLESWDCEVLEAINGKEALELLETANVELILLDLQMPVLDGFETIKIIRQSKNSKLRQLPVIALTAAALGDIQEKVFQAGMNDFVTKPFLPADFYAKLATHLPSQEIVDDDIMNTIRKKLIDTLGNDASIDRYLDVFRETITEEIARLQDAISAKDLKGLKKYAHKNKSSLKLVGLDGFASTLDELEKMVDRGSPALMVIEKAAGHQHEMEKIIEKMN